MKLFLNSVIITLTISSLFSATTALADEVIFISQAFETMSVETMSVNRLTDIASTKLKLSVTTAMIPDSGLTSGWYDYPAGIDAGVSGIGTHDNQINLVMLDMLFQDGFYIAFQLISCRHNTGVMQ